MSELSVRNYEGQWEVWLDATSGDFAGAIIGVGDDELEAIQDAIGELESLTTAAFNLREDAKTKGHARV